MKPSTYTVGAGQPVRDYRHKVDEPSRIKQMVFGHFSRCLHTLQKFDSDTERRFSVILERDALTWFTPANGQFKSSTNQAWSSPNTCRILSLKLRTTC